VKYKDEPTKDRCGTLLSKKIIQKFQLAWKKNYNEEISETDAGVMLVMLIEAYLLVAPKMPD